MEGSKSEDFGVESLSTRRRKTIEESANVYCISGKELSQCVVLCPMQEWQLQQC
jgi:hypothetical protein